MDDQRIGAEFRAVRLKRGWTQEQLGRKPGVSASLVSLIERGLLETLSVRVLRRVAAAVDIRVEIKPWLRAGDLIGC